MKTNSRKSRSAFTVAELIIGLCITAMIMLAVSGMMTAVAQGWNDQETTQTSAMEANQIYNRVQKALAGAKYIAQPTAGGAASSTIFFWQSDNYNGQSDLTPELGELALIEYDAPTQSIYLYQAIPYSQMTSSQLVTAGTVETWAWMTNSSSIAQFEGLSFVQRTTLGGPASATATASQLQVASAQFYVTSALTNTSQLPVVEFSIGFSKNGQSLTLYNTATLRSPTTQPN